MAVRGAGNRSAIRRRLGLRTPLKMAIVALVLVLGACAGEPLDEGEVAHVFVQREEASVELTISPLDQDLVPRGYLVTLEKTRGDETRYYEAEVLPPEEASPEQRAVANTLARALGRTPGPMRSDLAYALADRFPSLPPGMQQVVGDLMASADMFPTTREDEALEQGDAARHRSAIGRSSSMPCGGFCMTEYAARQRYCDRLPVGSACSAGGVCRPYSHVGTCVATGHSGSTYSGSSSSGSSYSGSTYTPPTSSGRHVPATPSTINYGLPAYGSAGSPSSYMFDVMNAGATSINTGRSGANCQQSYNSFGYLTCNNTWGY